MPGTRRMTEAIRVFGGAALLAAGLLALPADLTSQSLAVDLPQRIAAEQPAAGAVVSQPQAVQVETPSSQEVAAEDDFIIEENQFGVRMFDPSVTEVAELGTSAGVVAYPGSATQRNGLTPVDASIQTFDTSPLPVAEGAELVESQFDGWQWVAVTLDAERSLAEVEGFYADAFGGYEVTRSANGDAVKLQVTDDGRMLGWIGIVADGDLVRTRVTWNG